jgi:hypothetical protein
VINTDRSGFRSSLDMLREEDRHHRGAFDRVVDELSELFAKAEHDRWVAPLAAAARGNPKRTARVYRELDEMVKALPQPSAPRVVSIEVHDPVGGAAGIVAKSFDALRNDASLTPAARGEIMLRLSSIADRTFAKSEGVSARLDQVRRAIAVLEHAKAQHHIDKIDPLVEQIKEAARKGETEPGDLLAIESRLHEIKRELEKRESSDAEEK